MQIFYTLDNGIVFVGDQDSVMNEYEDGTCELLNVYSQGISYGVVTLPRESIVSIETENEINQRNQNILEFVAREIIDAVDYHNIRFVFSEEAYCLGIPVGSQESDEMSVVEWHLQTLINSLCEHQIVEMLEMFEELQDNYDDVVFEYDSALDAMILMRL